MAQRGNACLALALSLPIAVLAASYEAPAAAAQPRDYSQHSMVRLKLSDAKQLGLDNQVLEHFEQLADADTVSALLSPETRSRVRRSGVPFELVAVDVAALLEREAQPAPSAAREGQQAAVTLSDSAWFESYHSAEEIASQLEVLSQDPRAKLLPVGQSVEGRAVSAISITAAPASAPAILITGTQHAREWISPMTVMCLADGLLSEANADPEVKDLLSRLQILLVPMVNPDGYEYSRSMDRMWRKNRRGGFGVDLNRNWDAEWETGRSTNMSSDTFSGSGPFSEPETANLRDFMAARPELVAHFDYHSAAQVVAHPYAFTADPPANIDDIREVSELMATILSNVNGVEHGVVRTGRSGPAGGLAADYSVSKLGLLALTVELRAAAGNGFLLPPEQILPTCEENFPAFVAAAKWLAEKHPIEVPTAPTDAGASTPPEAGVPPVTSVPSVPGVTPTSSPPPTATPAGSVLPPAPGPLPEVAAPGGSSASSVSPAAEMDGCGCELVGAGGTRSQSAWAALMVIAAAAWSRRKRAQP